MGKLDVPEEQRKKLTDMSILFNMMYKKALQGAERLFTLLKVLGR